MIERIEILKTLKDNFTYALVSENRCAIVDPGEAAPVEKFLATSNLRLTHILCTHHHWDHVNGVPELASRFTCEVWCSDYDFARVPGATKSVSGEVSLFGDAVEVLFVPGHTLGQIAYYVPRLRAVFPGDTLFSAGCGRLFEGTPEQMFESMVKLRALPADTRVYFGHEYTLNNLAFVEKHGAADAEALSSYRNSCTVKLNAGLPTAPSTIETEMHVNPFLKAADSVEFTKWRELRNSW